MRSEEKKKETQQSNKSIDCDKKKVIVQAIVDNKVIRLSNTDLKC